MSVYLGAALLALAGALVFQRHKSPSKYEQNGILDSQPTMLLQLYAVNPSTQTQVLPIQEMLLRLLSNIAFFILLYLNPYVEAVGMCTVIWAHTDADIQLNPPDVYKWTCFPSECVISRTLRHH